ncbi:unnamed protein product [Auanema sp. JU1783]|nr:unnamed protein product [Auanema sp. JU1783]
MFFLNCSSDSCKSFKQVEECDFLGICSNCHLKGDEELFGVLRSNNDSLVNIDLKAICCCRSYCVVFETSSKSQNSSFG